jgi:hypothetical protein
MRRFLLYLPVCLITFALGVGAIILFITSQSQPVEVPVVPDVVQAPDPINIPVVEPEPANSDEGDICSGLDLSDYQEPAIEKWLRGEKFTGKPMRPPIEYRGEGDEYFPSLVDVDSDGRMELMVKTYCSPVHNCYFNIYEKVGQDYRQLFQTYEPGREVNFLSSNRLGYRDIEITTKRDSSSGFLSYYRFNGSYYDTSRCFGYRTEKGNRKRLLSIACYLVKADDQD